MTDGSDESRTLFLDKEVLAGVCSAIPDVRTEAILQLPDALSRQEVADIGSQVNLAPGPDAIIKGNRMETDALFYIGTTSLYKKHDLVTAENAAKELRRRGVMGIVGFLLLKNELRKVKKEVLGLLIDREE